ncbi:deoxynucleotide monophosphate kinase family protein [Streptomyces sp. NPDC002491]
MNVGIIGRANTGKDTAGEWFVNERGYRRVAFADPLKEAALKLNPIVEVFRGMAGGLDLFRLSQVVGADGWELAKELHEVRRILQELGSAVRAIDEDFWLRAALKKVTEANEAGVPVVITDVRYGNEAASLARSGFKLIHINRPGVPQLDHESERSLGPENAHFMVHNDGDIAELHRQLDVIYEDIWALESARQAFRH